MEQESKEDTLARVPLAHGENSKKEETPQRLEVGKGKHKCCRKDNIRSKISVTC